MLFWIIPRPYPAQLDPIFEPSVNADISVVLVGIPDLNESVSTTYLLLIFKAFVLSNVVEKFLFYGVHLFPTSSGQLMYAQDHPI